MPQARKSARSKSRASASYKEPAALKRLNRSLDGAQKALEDLRSQAGRNATVSTRALHKGLGKFLSDARRDTGKFTSALKRDFTAAQKAAKGATSSAASAASGRRSTGRSTAGSSTRKAGSSTRKAGSSTRKASGSTRKASGSRSTRKSS